MKTHQAGIALTQQELTYLKTNWGEKLAPAIRQVIHFAAKHAHNISLTPPRPVIATFFWYSKPGEGGDRLGLAKNDPADIKAELARIRRGYNGPIRTRIETAFAGGESEFTEGPTIPAEGDSFYEDEES